jgi:hypothetical protein
MRYKYTVIAIELYVLVMKEATKTYWMRFYVYFIIFTAVLSYSQAQRTFLYEYVDILITSLLLIGLWFFVHRSMVFSKTFWKIYVVLCMAWDVYIRFLHYSVTPADQLQAYQVNLLIDGVLFLAPMYTLALYFAYRAEPVVQG